MLNPFWHATLVPLEIDERGGSKNSGTDPTGPTRDPGARTMESLIANEMPGYGQSVEAAAAYRGLCNQIDGMAKPPQAEVP